MVDGSELSVIDWLVAGCYPCIKGLIPSLVTKQDKVFSLMSKNEYLSV
jgi:hypothetical protein